MLPAQATGRAYCYDPVMRKPSIASLIYYLIAAIIGVAIVALGMETDAAYKSLYARFTPEMRTEAAINRLLEKLSLGLYDEAETDRQHIAATSERVLLLRTWGNQLAVAFLILSVSFLALVGLQNSKRQRFTLHLLLVAALCLAIGLSAPMLSIVAQREVAVLGQVILRFESKAILQTIITLAAREQWVMAGALALFSVVVPWAKLCLGLVSVAGHGHARRWSVRVMHAVGRWSMTDVFVVAVLLAFMAGEAGDSTNAWVGHGLWFFASYALLSWLAAARLSSGRGSA